MNKNTKSRVTITIYGDVETNIIRRRSTAKQPRLTNGRFGKMSKVGPALTPKKTTAK